jgi:3-isopropylmalate/(R)-2-methylmalate dehydratase large subunit
MSTPRTLFDKIWDEHVVARLGDGVDLLHVDRHMVFELTGAIAYRDLAAKARRPRNPELVFATVDHVVSTDIGDRETATSAEGRRMLGLLRDGLARHPPRAFFDLGDSRQGIVHVVAPEQGIALPGLTLLAGDSHTCTVGGLGALAWGIGSSEVEHVLTTQTIRQKRPKRLRVIVDGRLAPGVYAKDIVLALIARIGAAGGTGHAVEFAGPAIGTLDIEARLTLCNMAIEFGARIGQVAPDDATYQYLAGRPFAPKDEMWERALRHWKTLPSDPRAVFDREVALDASRLSPQVSWGTSPEQSMPIGGLVPDPNVMPDAAKREAAIASLRYMGLVPGEPIAGTPIDVAFIGSCTNARLSDLDAAAAVVAGRKVAPGVRALVVPGSGLVAAAAEAKGLDRVFRDAGFEWRAPGCSMCVAANGDVVAPGQRAVSTSNRNFEGRQGPGARTHLASPATAAASAIAGVLADPRRRGA